MGSGQSTVVDATTMEYAGADKADLVTSIRVAGDELVVDEAVMELE